MGVMFVVFGFPIVLWLSDFMIRVYMAENLQQTLDNAVLTAVTNVEYDPDGHIYLNDGYVETEVSSMMGDALNDGNSISANAASTSYDGDLLESEPVVTFEIVNPPKDKSVNLYWDKNKQEFGTFDDAYLENYVDDMVGYEGLTSFTVSGEDYEVYYGIDSPRVYVHVALEYQRPLLGFMPPQTFSRVSGAEVNIGKESMND